MYVQVQMNKNIDTHYLSRRIIVIYTVPYVLDELYQVVILII